MKVKFCKITEESILRNNQHSLCPPGGNNRKTISKPFLNSVNLRGMSIHVVTALVVLPYCLHFSFIKNKISN